MKKSVEIKSDFVGSMDGVIGGRIHFELETEKYVIPASVIIHVNGKRLFPTSFDEHGNPQIDGLAGLLFIWNKRQMVRDGLLHSEYSKLFAECEYEIMTKPSEIRLEDRIAKMSMCPVCGKTFELSELEDGLESHENVLFHKDCLKDFMRLKEIDKITESVYYALRALSDYVPEWKKDLDYTLIPNEYCSGTYCKNRPWFLFTTNLGKIKIGWRKHVISMEFFDGFSGIDFSTLFKNEDETKWNTDGGFGIHADSYEKMYEYLKIVFGICKQR